jgi:hypothetical protein
MAAGCPDTRPPIPFPYPVHLSRSPVPFPYPVPLSHPPIPSPCPVPLSRPPVTSPCPLAAVTAGPDAPHVRGLGRERPRAALHEVKYERVWSGWGQGQGNGFGLGGARDRETGLVWVGQGQGNGFGLGGARDRETGLVWVGSSVGLQQAVQHGISRAFYGGGPPLSARPCMEVRGVGRLRAAYAWLSIACVCLVIKNRLMLGNRKPAYAW